MNIDDWRGIPQNIRGIRIAQLFREIPAVSKIREHINNANSIIACNYRGMLPMALCLVFANIVSKLALFMYSCILETTGISLKSCALLIALMF